MSAIVVFVGPTLPAAEVQERLPQASVRPPAAQGDLYRAARQRPAAIALIDGFFERVPAVWHKEILWALATGVPVFGAASMGALRAVELEPFGMVGVGWVFRAFRDGVLTADDEVAVAHGLAESGYRPLSEALVNIRRTLTHAVEAGVLSPAVSATLLSLARQQFYPERSYPALLRAGRQAGLSPEVLTRFARWLTNHRVDQKRADALELLALLARPGSLPPPPPVPLTALEETRLWQRARALTGDAPADLPFATLLDELRLTNVFRPLRQEALLRTYALAYARAHGLVGAKARPLAAAFQEAHGLVSEAAQEWADRMDLLPADLDRLAEEEAAIRLAHEQLEATAMRSLLDVLRLNGDYPHWASRARTKQAALARWGESTPALGELGLSEEQLLQWFFHQRLHRPLPPDLDQYALEAGFLSTTHFLQAVIREYWFCQRTR
jgi:hypothetical protein